ncbi:MAG: DUF4349 domain-containing protein [Haloferacaceae archaeon]
MSRRSRRPLAALLLAALLVLAGCSGAGGDGQAAEAPAVEHEVAESGGAGASDGADASASDGGSGADALRVRQRQVVRTGRVALTVDDYGRARRNLTRAARDLNGFVSDSTRRRHEVEAGTYVTGSVTLRVPRERFGEMMDRAASMGTVEGSETSSKDVTDRLVDIEARLTNLRQQRERLRTLYERANDTEDVLAVGRRLSETQERIERLEAEQRHLERRVAYSTITVELNEERPKPGPDAVQQWYDVPLVSAFLESVHGVTVAARALAVLAAYALPYLLAFLGPVGLVAALAVRRYRRGRDGGAPGDGADGEDDGDGDGPDAPADRPADADGADDGSDRAAADGAADDGGPTADGQGGPTGGDGAGTGDGNGPRADADAPGAGGPGNG